MNVYYLKDWKNYMFIIFPKNLSHLQIISLRFDKYTPHTVLLYKTKLRKKSEIPYYLIIYLSDRHYFPIVSEIKQD